MKSNLFSYTRMRKGTAVQWYKGRAVTFVDYCPVCGRKGAYHNAGSETERGYQYPIRVVHEENRTDMGIGIARTATDECKQWLPFQELINSAHTRFDRARPYVRRQIMRDKYIVDGEWPAEPYIS